MAQCAFAYCALRSQAGLLCLGNNMEEAATDVAASPAGWRKRATLAIRKLAKRLVVSGRAQGCVMEFVAAQPRPCWPKRSIAPKPGLAIAKLQLAGREARGGAERSRHRVANAGAVFESLAQNHVSAALAMDGPRLRKLRKARAKAMCGGKCRGMQLGIAAR